MLMPESRIHSHDQHMVEIWEDFFQNRRRSSRVNCPSSTFSKRLNALPRAVQIVVTFPMNKKCGRAGLSKLVQENVRIGNHQVRLQRQGAGVGAGGLK